MLFKLNLKLDAVDAPFYTLHQGTLVGLCSQGSSIAYTDEHVMHLVCLASDDFSGELLEMSKASPLPSDSRREAFWLHKMDVFM